MFRCGWPLRKMSFQTFCFCITCALLPLVIQATPVAIGQAQQIASAYADRNYAPVATAQVRGLLAAPAALSVASTRTLQGAVGPIGFVVAMAPAGFILIRADDDLPPVKLHTSEGSYETLPPGFRSVIETELAGELTDLAAMRQAGTDPDAGFHSSWQALAAVEQPSTRILLSTQLYTAGVVLTTTGWDQGNPYNYYAPAASGGPGGRAYAGCGATALAQLLRYHQKPAVPLSDYNYYDSVGTCVGKHALSDVGLGDYAWTNMPAWVSTSSSTTLLQAVGRLVYHCGVAMDSDFEAASTGTYSSSMRSALGRVFGFVYKSVMSKSSGIPGDWYSTIATEIDAERPLYYAMWTSSGGSGHVVVCDGYRNGSEIHLNLGWSGTGSAWYSISSVSSGGYTWTQHEATYGIQTAFPTGVAASDGAFSDRVRVSWIPVAGATSYKVYRSLANVSSGATLQGSVSTCSYDDLSALQGSTYYYWVKASNSAGDSAFSVSDSGYRPNSIELSSALDIEELIWTTGGAGPWFGQSAISHDGLDAARSGCVRDNQQSWLQTTVNGPITVSFSCKISSESGGDFLRFYIDDQEQSGSVSGTADWQRKRYAVPIGIHTLKWVYGKNIRTASGNDCCWLDEVAFGEPVVTANAIDTVVAAGNRAVLSVAATGEGPLTYQWYQGLSGNTGNPIEGATNSTFMTPQVSETVTYWVRVSNAKATIDSGSTTVQTGYAVSSLSDLRKVGSGEDGWTLDAAYFLACDIDASATATLNDEGTDEGVHEGFFPIGTRLPEAPFTGLFEGNGHFICGLTINRPERDGVGLFGNVGSAAVIRNVNLATASIEGHGYVGCLAGNKSGDVRNCSASGTVSGGNCVGGLIGYSSGPVNNCCSSGSVSGTSSVGGLIGANGYGSVVSNCFSTASTKSKNDVYSGGLIGGNSGKIIKCGASGDVAGYNYVGGLAGYSSGTVEECTASGTVSGVDYVGALVGYNDDASTVKRSFASGTVRGRNHVGGVVGHNDYNSTIQQCFASGSVQGVYSIGGLVGYNSAGTIEQSYATGDVSGDISVGGLTGYNYGNILDCYSTGMVSGQSNVGGIAGYNGSTIEQCYAMGTVIGTKDAGGAVGGGGSYGIVTGSYWDTQTSGYGTSTGGQGRVSVQMKQKATYVAWDFDTVWGVSENASYPFLQVFPTPFLLAVMQQGPGSVSALPQQGAYALGTVVTLSAHVAEGPYEFVGWMGNVADATSLVTTVTMDIHKSVKAVFRTARIIPSISELQKIGIDPDYPLDGHYWLDHDIDATSTAAWNDAGTDAGAIEGFKPIGDYVAPFKGAFDGKGHVIRGLTIKRAGQSYIGMFGWLGSGAAVRNLGILGCDFVGSYAVGGVVGYNQNGTVEKCYAAGTVEGGSSLGGLVGLNSGRIQISYAAVAVTGRDSVGGISGSNSGGTIETCYSAGAVSGRYQSGGLVGGYSNTVIGCYWDTDASGQAGSVGGIGRNTDEMRRQSTFTGWDFDSVWGIVADTSYPYLRMFPCPFALMVTARGPGSASMSPLQAAFAPGAVVTITAKANEGPYEFAGWLGDVANSTSLITKVKMDLHKSVTAVFRTVRSISSLAELQKIGNDPGYPLDARYWLPQSIDASEAAVWNDAGTDGSVLEGFKPIGEIGRPFTGVFDGNGYVISGLTIKRSVQDYVGLFGYLDTSAIVRNLELIGGAILGHNNVGGLAGWNQGTIEQCSVTGATEGGDCVGGLAGNVSYGVIERCSSSGTVIGKNNIGGFAGYNQYGGLRHDGSSAVVTGSYYVGGLVGNNGGSTTLSDCSATGAATGYSSGGLVGSNYGTITRCNATGAVTGSSNNGGLVGNNTGALFDSFAFGAVTGDESSSSVGGLVGYNSGTVKGCYATGAVKGNSSVGGLIGYCSSSSVTVALCYATGTVRGTNYCGGVVGLNCGVLKQCYGEGAVNALSYSGGFAGYNGGAIEQSYSIGFVSYVLASSYVGGLVGDSTAGTVSNSYWNTSTGGMPTSSGGIGKTTAQMKQQATYVGWDFTNVWGITQNVSYPSLWIFKTHTLTYLSGKGGSLLGLTTQYVRDGSYGTAVAVETRKGYCFLKWSDGRKDNPRTDTNVLSNRFVTAEFVLNEVPVADDKNVIAVLNKTREVALSGSDADNDALAFQVISQPLYGTLSGMPPNLIYTPWGDYSGPDSFRYTVFDGIAYSPAATVSISVAPFVRRIEGQVVTIEIGLPSTGVYVWAVEETLPIGLTPLSIVGSGAIWDAATRKLSFYRFGATGGILSYSVIGESGWYTLAGIATLGGPAIEVIGDDVARVIHIVLPQGVSTGNGSPDYTGWVKAHMDAWGTSNCGNVSATDFETAWLVDVKPETGLSVGIGLAVRSFEAGDSAVTVGISLALPDHMKNGPINGCLEIQGKVRLDDDWVLIAGQRQGDSRLVFDAGIAGVTFVRPSGYRFFRPVINKDAAPLNSVPLQVTP